ncbi:hypothetical protein ABZ208_04235 [Streptomyces sp. NPDC006208]|uniref:hypothetical protein n=1 Tax=Streptomyces sp. NPDC006208 TaxID=3156734 RepID=UPI0033ADD899
MGKPVLGTGAALAVGALMTSLVLVAGGTGTGSAAVEPAAPPVDMELGGRPNLIVPAAPSGATPSSSPVAAPSGRERTSKPAPPAPRAEQIPKRTPSSATGNAPTPSRSLPPTGTVVPTLPQPDADCYGDFGGDGGGGRGGHGDRDHDYDHDHDHDHDYDDHDHDDPDCW